MEMFSCDRARRLSLPSQRQKAFHTFRARTQRRPRRRERRASVRILFAKAEILAPPNPPEPMVPNTRPIHRERSFSQPNERNEDQHLPTNLSPPSVILCEACSSTALSYRGCSPELPLTSMGVEKGVFPGPFPATARGDFRSQANGKRVSTHFAPGPNEGPDDGNGALPSGSFLRKQKS